MKFSLFTKMLFYISINFIFLSLLMPTNSLAKTNQAKSFFNFSSFNINKHGIGSIRIGMSVKVAESKIKGLKKRLLTAYKFGVDSESLVPCYYLGNSLVFALITQDKSDKISLIVAVDERLKTITGLTPKSSLFELNKKYTNLVVWYNQLTHQEEFSDKINKWNFVFDTNDNNRIGKYLDNQRTDFAKPQRLNESSIYLIIE